MLSLLHERTKFNLWEMAVMNDLRSLNVRAQMVYCLLELQGGDEVAGVVSDLRTLRNACRVKGASDFVWGRCG